MNYLTQATKKRKVLSLTKQPDPLKVGTTPRHFVQDADSVFMVFNPDGHMPKRVYLPSEKDIAIGHAKALAKQFGGRFYVMRSWRGFEGSAADGE